METEIDLDLEYIKLKNFFIVNDINPSLSFALCMKCAARTYREIASQLNDEDYENTVNDFIKDLKELLKRK